MSLEDLTVSVSRGLMRKVHLALERASVLNPGGSLPHSCMSDGTGALLCSPCLIAEAKKELGEAMERRGI